jgi:DNA modification methylase
VATGSGAKVREGTEAMIHTGDCIEVMAGMPADSVDAVVTA